VPRVGLTQEKIVREAANVADEVGLEQLTLAAVAKRCGVSLPGLYKHIEGLNSVKRDIAVLAVREMTRAMAAAVAGLSGRHALRALAAAYRDYATAHPGRYIASVRAPAPGDVEHTEVSDQAIGIIQAALQGYDLQRADLIHAIRMLRIACHGISSLEAEGAFGLPESLDVTFDRLVNALDADFRHS
jgi:AcrR family transcriptional regulator